jgi:predicted nuclease of predicted toxin-antitoxin system
MAVGLRVYLDEDVDVLLSRLLKARGFDSVTASELGHLGWSDEQHLEWADTEDRVTITHNRVDFENLARQWWTQSRGHGGVVLAVRRANSYELLRRVLPVLSLYDQAGWHNVVMYA